MTTTKKEEKELNIALCFSGALRTFTKCAQLALKSYFEKLQSYGLVTLFAHTWSPKSEEKKEGQLVVEKELNEGFSIFLNLSKNVKIGLYEIEVWEEEKLPCQPLKQFYTHKAPETNVNNTISMFTSMNKCNQLKKKYETYYKMTFDLCFRIRFDTYFGPITADTKGLDFVQMWNNSQCKEHDKNIICMSNEGHFGNLCDQFAFGSSSAIDHYTSAIYDIETYHKNGLRFHPEIIMLHHVNNKKCIVKMFPFPLLILR